MAQELFTWAAETHVGNHREHNEDRYDSFICPLGTVFVVCDGMGGHEAGDVAATMAIQRIKDMLQKAPPTGSIPYWLRRAFFHAHYDIQNYGQMHYGSGGMGTTAVALLITPQGEAWWAHTGDSRLYLLREGKLHRLTHDHSYVSLLVDAGYITPESAFGHPQSNQLLFTLGTSNAYTVVEASSYPIKVQKGDIFLLCSDGVSGLIPDEQISAILAQSISLPDKARHLIQAALQAGGYDNATAILVEVLRSPVQSSMARPAAISRWGLVLTSIVALSVGFLIGQAIPLRQMEQKKPQQAQRQDTVRPPSQPSGSSLTGAAVDQEKSPTSELDQTAKATAQPNDSSLPAQINKPKPPKPPKDTAKNKSAPSGSGDSTTSPSSSEHRDTSSSGK